MRACRPSLQPLPYPRIGRANGLREMSMNSPTNVCELTDKIALELVFAEPGKDSGLLPINSLLGEIESLSVANPVPEVVRQAIALARQWVDAAFDAGGLAADIIKRFGAWACWMREALTADTQGRSIPALPEALTALPTSPQGAPPLAALPPDENEGGESLLLNIASNADLLREFVAEAQEHLHQIELDALELEKDPADADTLNSLFRSFHTLKGGSGFLNLLPMNRLAHQLEALLDLTRQGKLIAHGDVIDIILDGRDALRQFVTEIDRQLGGQDQGTPIVVPTGKLLSRIEAVQQGELAGQAPAPEPAAASPAVPTADRAPDQPAEEEAKPSADTRRSSSGFVKVDTAKLDSLVDLVGELVIAQSLVTQDADLRSVQSQQLSRNLAQLGRSTNELQHIAMSLRMVPIRGSFQKMTRLVRDVAAKAGKQVELRLSGEGTELDRNLIEEINDPLIHLIRNAVDHGVESPERRAAQGKPARGVVQLRAFHLGGNIVIEVEDDGAGLNKERILAKGIQAGLVTAGEQLTDQEIFALIFAPGLSTAEKVTDISGRGVGMDVVQRNISKLRGKIEVRSTPGKGSTISIHLPLTLAIIDGLIFTVGPERFIVPTLCVRESFRPAAAMISTVQGRGEMVSVRGQLSPLLRLYQQFGLQPDSTDPTESIIIMVETNRHHRCLMVDRLIGKQEVVIKGLGNTFKQSQGLAGAAILGDGRVGLILDVNGLVSGTKSHVAHN
jgi:two-component system chemotaxis sensor kinase CheA